MYITNCNFTLYALNLFANISAKVVYQFHRKFHGCIYNEPSFHYNHKKWIIINNENYKNETSIFKLN